jgi:hypothetical protein
VGLETLAAVFLAVSMILHLRPLKDTIEESVKQAVFSS